jgi:hypothetical protein
VTQHWPQLGAHRESEIVNTFDVSDIVMGKQIPSLNDPVTRRTSMIILS